MKPSVHDIVAELAAENGLEIDYSICADSEIEPKAAIFDWIRNNPEEVSEIIAAVIAASIYGDVFYKYFSDDDKLPELIEMHKTDPDKFYDNVKSYETFLNLCADAAGYNMRFHLNLSNLLR